MRQGQDYGGTQDRGSRDYQEDAFHFQPLPGAYGRIDLGASPSTRRVTSWASGLNTRITRPPLQ